MNYVQKKKVQERAGERAVLAKEGGGMSGECKLKSFTFGELLWRESAWVRALIF